MPPRLLILKAQMAFQPLHIFLCQRKLFKKHPRTIPRVTLLVRHIVNQCILLNFCLRVVKKNTDRIPARIVIRICDIRKTYTDFVYQILILESKGNHDHSLCEITLVKNYTVPRKNHRRILYLFLLHAVRQIFQDSVMKPCLLLTFKNFIDCQGRYVQVLIVYAVDMFTVLILNAASNDSINSVMISGHKSRCHLEIIGIGLNHFLCSYFTERGILHIAVIIGNSQPLVPCSALHDFHHTIDRIARFIKAHRPETGNNSHAVVGPGHLQSSLPINDSLADIFKKFGRYPVHRFGIAYACPSGYCSLHCGKSQKIIFPNRLQYSKESFCPAAVRIFTDCLTNSFLQSCGYQELCKEIMKLCITGLYDSAYKRYRDHHRIIVAEDGFPHSI